MRTVIVIALAAASALVPAAAGRADSRLRVVAAENVYGDIAAQIGGARVDVTSILSDPNADPHLFEPGSSNGLAVSLAGVVIQNGLGYDAFMTRLEEAAPSNRRVIVTVADELGVRGKDANPHLWYDVPALARVARAIELGLERADKEHARGYRRGLARFTASLRPLQAEVARIRHGFAGRAVAYTEPVPGYLVAAAGLRNLAPAGFTRAIEDGTDPTPQAVAQMQTLLTKRRVRVLLYNSQAVTPLTKRLRDLAVAAHIPVVPVTETLPAGLSFQRWQLAQAHALRLALAQ